MGQGRISFSGNMGAAFPLGVLGRDDRDGGAPGGSRGDYADQVLIDSMSFRSAPEVADRRLMESIERKRTLLRQTSLMQRDRIERFVALLFDEASDECGRMVEDGLADSGDPQKVVETLLEPAARRIGETWCGDECDFLKVTIAVSRMQRLFRRAVAECPPTARSDISRCVLLGPAPGEEHLFGLAVVDDAFRRAGWEVDCCGHGEDAEMMRLASANHYQVIGISVSVERLLPALSGVIRKLKSTSLNKSVRIIAGGSMVLQNPQGAIDAGFDLLAVDALAAVGLAEAGLALAGVDAHEQMAAE